MTRKNLLPFLFLGILFIFQGLLSAQGNFADSNYQGSVKPGLTLSGGGAKGLAHIGVLHILDSLGIQVDYISVTSMGSNVGAI